MDSGLGTAGIIFLFLLAIGFVVGCLVLAYLMFFRHSERGSRQASLGERWNVAKNQAVYFDELGKLKMGVHISRPYIIGGEEYRDFSVISSQGVEDFLGKFCEKDCVKIDCEAGSDVSSFVFVGNGGGGKVYAGLRQELNESCFLADGLAEMVLALERKLEVLQRSVTGDSLVVGAVRGSRELVDAARGVKVGGDTIRVKEDAGVNREE